MLGCTIDTIDVSIVSIDVSIVSMPELRACAPKTNNTTCQYSVNVLHRGYTQLPLTF